MTPGPWQRVEVEGQLEKAETEFLHTNGAGAYTMSTLALLHTRRQHGLLVAALDPPRRRHVVVSHIDTIVTTNKRAYRLGSYQFPEVAPTPGYRYLRSFAADPLPRFNYRLGSADLEVTLGLVRGENALIVAYRWFGPDPVRLSLKPLLAMRPISELSREHGAMLQRISMRQGAVELQPVANLPPLVLRHGGMFMGSPDWWRRFEYTEDKHSGIEHEEDLWTPGTIELSLDPGRVEHVTFGLERLPSGSAAERMEETTRYLRSLDPGEEHALSVRALSIAADSFRVDHCAKPAIVAGYPSFSQFTRDTLISLPGLYLTSDRIDSAKRVMKGLLSAEVDGLLSYGIREDGTPSREASVDGTLWLFQAARLLAKKCTLGDPFIREELFPALTRIYRRISNSRELVWRSRDGLLASGAPHSAPTWMDSRARNEILVPRRGIAVELQALWSMALGTLASFASEYGEAELASKLETERVDLLTAFRLRFWCETTGYPYDCLGESGDKADAAIRPNAVIALDLEPDLFESWQAIRILEVARARLVTSSGLRSLDPEHPQYLGHYEVTLADRPITYHRGACWPFLLGAYARAALRVRPSDFELQIDLRHLLERAVRDGLVLGQVPQVAGGDVPHHAGGCPAQAWNVAEILRVLLEDLEL